MKPTLLALALILCAQPSSADVALSFAPPTFDADSACGRAAHPCIDLAGVRVEAKVQSATWGVLRWLVDVQGWPESELWAAMWPTVRAEAEPFTAADTVLVWSETPARVAVQARIPGTGPAWAAAVARDYYGHESPCRFWRRVR